MTRPKDYAPRSALAISMAVLSDMKELPTIESSNDERGARKFCSRCGGNTMLDKAHVDSCKCN